MRILVEMDALAWELRVTAVKEKRIPASNISATKTYVVRSTSCFVSFVTSFVLLVVKNAHPFL